MNKHKVRTVDNQSRHHHHSNKSRKNMKNLEIGKRLLCFCGSVALLSLILNIVAFIVLFNLQAHVESRFETIFDRSNRNQQDTSNYATNSVQNSEKLKSDFQRQIDELTERSENAEEEINELSNKISNTDENVIETEKRINSSWRKGCPQHGLTNGTLCYVINTNRENYTTALESCQSEEGVLAIINDKALLGIITENFPAGPFFVDAFYSAGYWKTSSGKIINFFPWAASERGSEGDCVYGYRGGYSRWHCHAHLPYLCLF